MITKKRNQRKHLMDLSSSMGLTTRELQLSRVDNRRYFEVLNDDGDRYCQCGTEEDAKMICSLHSGFTYQVHLLPPTPKTVNVTFTVGQKDKELPPQNILPDRQQEPLNLNV